MQQGDHMQYKKGPNMAARKSFSSSQKSTMVASDRSEHTFVQKEKDSPSKVRSLELLSCIFLSMF